MSAFVPNADQEPEEEDVEIVNTDFFPNLKVGEFRERMKVLEEFPLGRVLWQLKKSVLATNRELHKWHLEKIDAGYATLEEVPQESLGEEKTLVLHYTAAVYHRAKVYLTETGRDVDLTNDGADATDFAEETIEDHLRHVREAIATIIGRKTVTAELI